MTPTLTAKLTRLLSFGIAIVLLLLPFHAFLTVWISSGIGHYTLLRLWKEIFLVVIGLVALVLLIRDKALLKILRQQQITWLIVSYLLLQLFLGFTSLAHNQVSGKALAYGLLDDTRFLLFFGLCVVIATHDNWLRQHWRPLILIPAAVVVIFGLLQVSVLPHDFLQHFGYSAQTIPAIETVNSNAHYMRATSTLRGANPFGAYLVLIIAILAVECIRTPRQRDRLLYGLGGLLSIIALYYTYSRGAWIGTVLALICIALVALRTTQAKQLLLYGLPVVVLIVVFGVWALGSNAHFKNIIFHTSPHTVATTSDEGHDNALRQGISDVLHDPLGRGPGTAGPASQYNHDRPARIPENYFVQIGQEVGWLGLVLFVVLCVLLGTLLFRARADSLALALFASLIGLSFVGLVSQVWTDDTLCYVWWGLAGIALAPKILVKPKAKH
jgi:hypothetical protein